MAVTEKQLAEVKRILSLSLKMSDKDANVFAQIPDKIFENVFENNLNGNMSLFRKIVLNQIDDIYEGDLDNHIKNIHNYDKAATLLTDAIKDKTQVLFITDNDNDGSSAQASLIEFKDIFGDNNTLVTEYWQQKGSRDVRGFSYDYVKYLYDKLGYKPEDDILIVTADNGINSREDASLIEKHFPGAKLLITDHHQPSDSVVLESDRVTIFNPKYKPNKYFQTEKNISGAHVLGELLIETIDRVNGPINDYNQQKEVIKNISRVSNMLDYVNTDIRHQPLKHHQITKFSQLGNIMNTTNSSRAIIDGDWDFSDIEELKNRFPDINDELLVTEFKKINRQNYIAYKLLNIISNYENGLDYVGDKVKPATVYAVLLDELLRGDFTTIAHEVNTNFVEQLRPYLINYGVRSQKDKFMDISSEIIENIFRDIKKSESNIMNEFRKIDLIDKIKDKNSTTLMSKGGVVNKLFARKFLMKMFNEENNGFFLIINHKSPELYSGSMRSTYNVNLYLDRFKDFEREWGVELSHQGHDVAAGFFIKSNGKDVTDETIEAFNKKMSEVVQEVKNSHKIDPSDNIIVSIDGVKLIDSINKAVRAHLPNKRGIEPLIRLSKEMYLTNHKTAGQSSLEELIADKKYGYQSVSTNFDGDCVILATEMLRSVSESNYKNFIRLGYIDDGTFIAKELVDAVTIPESILEITGKQQDRKELTDYYNKVYNKDNGYSVKFGEDTIKALPFFKNNPYGKKEYSEFEQFVVGLVDDIGIDGISIMDTEGTGLGQAPKLFNFGAYDISVDEESGIKITNDDHKKIFKNFKGNTYYIDKRINYKKVSDEEYENLSIDKKSLCIENEYGARYIVGRDEEFSKLLRVTSIKKTEDGYTINRKLKGEMVSLIINNKDIKLSQEIIELTGIDMDTLKRVGMSSMRADKVLKERYEGKNYIMSAHNISYDKGIIDANLQEFSKVVNSSLLVDSAEIARNQRLAYDETDIAVFKVDELKGIEFFDATLSDFNVEEFLANDSEIEFYPDRSGRYTLRRTGDRLNLIDKKTNSEILLKSTPDDLLTYLERKKMNYSAIKYSVNACLQHKAIRDMLLSDPNLKKKVTPNLTGYNDLEVGILKFLSDGYHFDKSVEKNHYELKSAILTNGTKEEKKWISSDEADKIIMDFTNKLLRENRVLASKFQEAWMYKEIMLRFNPERKVMAADVVSDISEVTQIPAFKVKEIVDTVVDYKRRAGVDSVIPVEEHNNINIENADVAYESLPILQLIGKDFHTPYSHPGEKNLPMYNYIRTALETKRKMLPRLTVDKPRDAYSVKQAKNFIRMGITDTIKKSLNPENNRFKLGGDVLPAQTTLELITDKKISMDDVKEIEEPLRYLAETQMFINSVNISESISELINSNDRDVQEARKKIIDVVGEDSLFIFERKSEIRKSILERMERSIITLNSTKGKKITSPSHYMQEYEEDNFVRYADELIETAEKLKIIEKEADQEIARELLDDIIEEVVQQNGGVFGDYTLKVEDSKGTLGLSTIDGKVMSPATWLLSKHQDIAGNLLFKRSEEMKKKIDEATMKRRPTQKIGI